MIMLQVADLVEMLFDENNILNSMKESGVNLEEMPLGAVTAERVDKAREIILKIKQHLETAPVICGHGIHSCRAGCESAHREA